MSEWSQMKFIDFILLQRGYDLTKSEIKEGPYPVVTSTSLMGYHNKYKVEGPGVVIGRSGTIGVVQYIEENYWPHNTSLYVKDFKGNYPKYVYYFMRFFGSERAQAGSAVPTLNRNNLSFIDVSVPPLETQHRIAGILSRYDELIENYRRQIKLLEEAAQRLYNEWFVKLRFPGHESVKIVDGVPEGWERRTLADIADVVMGQSPKSDFFNSNSEGLPFHQGVSNYGSRFVVDDIYTTSYTRIAESNSILFSVRAPVGRLNVTKNRIVIGRGLSALNQKKGFQSFLFYLLKNRFYKDDIIGNGSIFASLSKGDLLSLSFIVPSTDLISQFDKEASIIDRKISICDSSISLLTEARDRLLPKLMSGEIEA